MAGIAQKAAEEFARQMFIASPDLSIDEAARQISDRFKGNGIHKSRISEIRNNVRERMPFNTPRLAVAVQQDEESAVTTLAKHVRNIIPKTSSTEIRRAFLSDWAEKHPDATIQDARDALDERFGKGLGIQYINDTMKAARELFGRRHVLLQAARAPKMAKETKELGVKNLVIQMRAMGINKITLSEDGGVKVEFEEFTTPKP